MAGKGSNVLNDIFTVNDYVALQMKRYSDEMIAQKLCVSVNTLDRWKKMHRVNRKTVNRIRAQYIQQKINQGWTAKRIASTLSLNVRNVYYIMKQYGVKTNETNQVN